jgi:N-methylhydantoinase B
MTGPSLRDLDDGAFRARYGCDRFTSTVLANKFRHVVGHMANRVRTHAFSPTLRDASDLCATLCGPPELGYPMAALSETMPLFYGSIQDAVRIALEEHGVEKLRPGDVLIVNDYYRVGTHLNDVACIRPLLRDGELIGAVSIRAHFADMGGVAAGGFVATKRTTWEDGLRIPPMLLCEEGEIVTSTLKLLFANTRFGNLCVPDLLTQVQALEMGDRRVQESIDRYGLEAFRGSVRYACDASAESMSAALRRVPDGVYEGQDWLDGDGLPDSPDYRVHVRITKAGGRAEFDFSRSSATTRSAVNSAWPDIKTSISIALKYLLDPASPVTSGTLRDVDAVIGADSIMNPSPPAPCMMYFTVVVTAVYAIFDALNPVLGEGAVATGYVPCSALAYGRRPDGLEGVLSSGAGPTILGPWGATRHGDADSCQQGILSNLLNAGAEIYELAAPALWLSSDYVPDTAGAGTFRGGASSAHDVMWTRPAEHAVELLFHSRRPPAGGGVRGGRPGPTTAAWIWDGEVSEGATVPVWLPVRAHDPVYRSATPIAGLLDDTTGEVADPCTGTGTTYLPGNQRTPRAAGAVVRQMTCGGGGWGDPFARDPERVRVDVRDEYVTVDGAARDYGVVVVGDLRFPERLTVDAAATRALRASHRGGSPVEGSDERTRDPANDAGVGRR